MAAKRMWRHLRHDARVYAASLQLQAKAAASLRGAFVAQVLGMVLNNAALIVAWFFFFHHFGTVNGWSVPDFVGMQGVVMVVFGAMVFSSTGLMDLPRHIDTGSFDGFLTKPVSVLGQAASSNIDITTVGDMLLGIVLVIWYIVHIHAGVLAIVLLLVTMASASAVFWSFAQLLPNVLAFYVFDSERLSRYAGMLFMDAMNYPTGVVGGALRTVLLTALPALLVGVVPLDVLRGLHWEWVILGVLVAMGWLAFSLWLFRRSLKRYESANLVGTR